jgi:hypothetical protein
MPLLEFHEYRSKCAKGGDSENSGKQNDNDDDDVDDWTDYGDDKFPGRWNPSISDIANNPQHAVKRHPFILTRCV